MQGFPGDSVVKNPPANAEDVSLIPGPGRSHIPGDSESQAPQPLKPSAKSRAPQQEKPLLWKAQAQQLDRSPRSLQPEEGQVQQQGPSIAINKWK